MNDLIELCIPVKADLVVLARLTAATVASRAGFDVEEIEDLRLAVDELCLSLVRASTTGRFELRYSGGDGVIEISATLCEARTSRPGQNRAIPDTKKKRTISQVESLTLWSMPTATSDEGGVSRLHGFASRDNHHEV